MNPVIPMDGGHRLDEGGEGLLELIPFLATFPFLLLLIAGLVGFLLWRSGRLAVPTFWPPAAPELEARRILAERFARGDIDSDDFMERASTLNWTPGVVPVSQRRRPS